MIGESVPQARFCWRSGDEAAEGSNEAYGLRGSEPLHSVSPLLVALWPRQLARLTIPCVAAVKPSSRARNSPRGGGETMKKKIFPIAVAIAVTAAVLPARLRRTHRAIPITTRDSHPPTGGRTSTASSASCRGEPAMQPVTPPAMQPVTKPAMQPGMQPARRPARPPARPPEQRRVER